MTSLPISVTTTAEEALYFSGTGVESHEDGSGEVDEGRQEEEVEEGEEEVEVREMCMTTVRTE